MITCTTFILSKDIFIDIKCDILLFHKNIMTTSKDYFLFNNYVQCFLNLMFVFQGHVNHNANKKWALNIPSLREMISIKW